MSPYSLIVQLEFKSSYTKGTPGPLPPEIVAPTSKEAKKF